MTSHPQIEGKTDRGRSSALQTTIPVIAAAHPLLTAHTDYELPAGLTLTQILEVVQPNPMLRRHAHIFVNHDLIPVEKWAHTFPTEGQKVLIRVVPGRGAIRAILTIAILVVGTVFGGPLGGILGLSGTLASAVGTALIAGGGSLLLNAIAPIRPSAGHEQQRDSPNYFLDRARNAARPFGPIPVVLGRHRMVPPLGAASYTELPERRQGARMDQLGDEQYLRMLVIWGYGPLKISDLRIGETLINDFDDVQIETREGRAGEPPLTLYTEDVNEQALSVELTSSLSWVERTTARDADEISVDLTLPRGLFRSDDQGKRQTLSLEFDLQYREVGSPDWIRPPFVETRSPAPPMQDPNDPSMYLPDTDHYGGRTTTAPSLETHTAEISSVTLTSNRAVPLRVGYSWRTGATGQYKVRIQRTTPDRTSEREFDLLYWTALRSSTSRDPIAFGPALARTAIVIRASDQLQGAIDDLNAIVSSFALDWNGSAWVESETSNQASLYRLVLQGPARATPAPDSLVDRLGLSRWHEYCEANGLEYNAIRDFEGSVFDVLSDIAATGFASPSYADGKWGVVVDDGAQLPVQHFTPRNSANFRAERHFEPAPEALRIGFTNRDEGWRNDEQIVYRDGFDEDNAEVFASISAPGITDSDHIYKFGRRHLAQILLRREAWTFDVDFEHLVAIRGDRVKVSHDVLLIGQKSARIKAVDLNASGEATGIEIDEEVRMVSGTDYGVSIRTIDDVAVPVQVVTMAGADITNLAFRSPIPSTTPITKGDLLAFGEFGLETVDGLLVAITSESELRGQLTVLPWSSPGVYDAETGPIPPYETGLTPLPHRRRIVIEEVRSDESALVLQGGILTPRIVVEVLPIPDPDSQIDCQIRAGGTNEPYYNAQIESQTSESVIVSGVDEESTYDLRLRWRVPGTIFPAGPWTEIIGHRVIGRPDPPPALAGLALHSWGENSLLIRWDPIEPAEIRAGGQVRFRHSEASANPTWGDAISVGEPIYRESYAILPFKPGWYLARVFDADEDGSAVVFISATAPQLLDYANLVTRMESPAFPGVKSNVEVSGVALVLSAGQEEGTYQFEDNIDLSLSKQVRITSVLSVSGTDNTDAFVEFRTTPDDPDSAGAVWSVWRRLDTEQIEARGFEVRLQVVRSGSDRIRIIDLGVAVDEPITTGLNWRGPWAAGTDYANLDAVSRDNAAWVCIQPHTSAADNAPGTVGGDPFWDLLVDSFRWRGPWRSGLRYVTQDIVANEGRSWVSQGDHLSSAANEPTEANGGGVYWDLLADIGDAGLAGNDGHGFEWRGAWAEGVNYSNTALLQDLVAHNRQAFVCLQTHTSSAATEPGTAGGAGFWALLAGAEVDTRRPDAPAMGLAATGLRTDDFYVFLAGITLSSELGAVSVDQTQIQVSTVEAGHSLDNGWANPLQDILVSRPPVAQTLLITEYGIYHVSARVRNGVTREWSQWSAPLSALTIRGVPDTGLPSPPILRAVRPDRDGDAVELIIERPLSNFQTIWQYGIQANIGASGPDALPANRDYATSVRSVQASGSGTIVPGGRILTVAGSPGWAANEHAGKILYIYRTTLTDFATGAVEFPQAVSILSNTADTVTARPGSSFRAAALNPLNYTFAFLIADTWLRVPEDLVTNQGLVLRDEGSGTLQEIPLETNHQLLLSQETWIRVNSSNLFGYGPWSSRVLVPAPGGMPSQDPAVVLTASSLSISPGASVTLFWSSTKGVSASIDEGVGAVTPVGGGSVQVTPASSITYEITVLGAAGTTPATASVRIMVLVPGAPRILTFAPDDSTIETGESTTLRWTTENGVSASINQGIGSVGLNTSVEVSPTSLGDHDYVLTLTGVPGTTPDEETTTVTVVSCSLPVIDSFSATPMTIDSGGTTELAWETTGATSVSITDNPNLAVDGDLEETLTASKTYVLTATNPCGSVTRSITVTVGAPGSPGILTFAPDDSTIETGESTTLRWTTENGVSASIAGIGSVGLNSSVEVSPTSLGDHDYVLTLTGEPGTTPVNRTTTVTVICTFPVINSFSATPMTIDSGGTTRLAWETTGATSLTINSANLAVDGTLDRTLTASRTYLLRATNDCGSVTRSITVTVRPPGSPRILTFAPDDSTIETGESTTLRWTTENGVSASINQGIGSVGLNTSVEVSPTSLGDHDYVLTLTGVPGTTPVNRTTTVTVICTFPVINSFSATPMTIDSGGTTRLAWETTGATSLNINSANLAVDGTLDRTLTASRTYLLTATNDCGSVTRSITVRVRIPPTVDSFTRNPSTIDEGGSSLLSWETSDATAVSINQGVGTVPINGSVSVSPTVTTIYTITATNSDGTDTETVTVTVTPTLALPTIDSFSVSPSSIVLGSSVTVSWQTTGATSVDVTAAGSSISGLLDGSATYTPDTLGSIVIGISATNSEGTVQQSTSIFVTEF